MIFKINLNFKLLTNITNQELSQKKIIGNIAEQRILKKLFIKENLKKNVPKF